MFGYKPFGAKEEGKPAGGCVGSDKINSYSEKFNIRPPKLFWDVIGQYSGCMQYESMS